VFGRWASEGYRTREDRKAIETLIGTLEAKVKADDVAAAYQLFSSRFTAAIDEKRFADRLKLLQDYYGKVTRIDSNGLIEFTTDDASGDRFAFTTIQVTFPKSPTPLKDTAMLHKSGSGQWQFERMSELFPPPAPSGQQQPQQQGRKG
jgi:hypothetical protein